MRAAAAAQDSTPGTGVPATQVRGGPGSTPPGAVPAAPVANQASPAVADPADIRADLVAPPAPGVRTLHSTPGSFDSAGFQLLEESSGVTGAAKKVLLVEDEDALRCVMKDLLEREGFVVFEAPDGVKALDEIDRAGPDIVVLDLNLPRLDGYGVLSHLRSRPATANLPVIVLTAKGDEDSEVRVFEYGASDYLTKPFRPRALSARLHSLLGRAK